MSECGDEISLTKPLSPFVSKVNFHNAPPAPVRPVARSLCLSSLKRIRVSGSLMMPTRISTRSTDTLSASRDSIPFQTAECSPHSALYTINVNTASASAFSVSITNQEGQELHRVGGMHLHAFHWLPGCISWTLLQEWVVTREIGFENLHVYFIQAL